MTAPGMACPALVEAAAAPTGQHRHLCLELPHGERGCGLQPDQGVSTSMARKPRHTAFNISKRVPGYHQNITLLLRSTNLTAGRLPNHWSGSVRYGTLSGAVRVRSARNSLWGNGCPS